jgi:hypothetical protein
MVIVWLDANTWIVPIVYYVARSSLLQPFITSSVDWESDIPAVPVAIFL